MVAGFVGTVIEYFDFLVYGTVSGLVFGKIFFPGEDAFVGSLLAMGTFAVGFLARPIVGIISGTSAIGSAGGGCPSPPS